MIFLERKAGKRMNTYEWEIKIPQTTLAHRPRGPHCN